MNMGKKMMKKPAVCVAMALLACVGLRAQMQVGHLTVEHMEDPTTVDAVHPRLSWINEECDPGVRGNRQTAYRIVVASTVEKLDSGLYDLWDSGRRLSDRSTLVPYEGRQLRSGDDCYWKVQTWDAGGKPSAWSRVGHWGMGLLSPDDWQASWIASGQPAGAPLFRKAFHVGKRVRKAKAYVSAGGYFELYINGQRVGDDYLVPNFTNYTERAGLDRGALALDARFTAYRVLYLAYDVTGLLRPEGNAVGAILGDGFYRCTSRWVKSFGEPCLLCQIEITYDDGTTAVVASDGTWLTKPSPITMTGVYDGEVYDARAETPHWAEAECDETEWQAVRLATPPTGVLTAHTSPADRICEVLQPVGIVRDGEGNYEVAFEKEISGWVRLKDIRGEAGQSVRVKYVCESPLGKEEYICKGGGSESYAPRFTWYVFSKVVVSGLERLDASQIQAEAVNTDVAINSEFRTSNAMLNTINSIWQRTQLDNMHGCVPSDCPHRERSPYTGDGQVAAAMVMQNFDAAAFYQKWMRDIRDAQNPVSGYVPNGAPWQPGCGGGVAWGAAMNVIPWEYFVQYGDTTMLRDSYEPMKKQLRHMLGWVAPDGTMWQQKLNEESKKPCYWFNLGDWVGPYGMPSDEVVHTFYLWLCAENTAQAARVLGKSGDYDTCRALAERTKEAFHRKYYDAEARSYGDYGANVLALWMGVPADRERAVEATLRKEIMDDHGGHINTGFVATKFFFETLSRHGMHDVAVAAILKEDFPSYGHWIRQGATVMWENWDGRDSRNHPMFGGGLTWLARCLAGVNADEEGAGYRHFEVRPIPTPGVDSVYYSIRTVQGKVASRVVAEQGRLQTLEVEVPVGSTATVELPAVRSAVRESGRKLKIGRGIAAIAASGGTTRVEVRQGVYRFTFEERSQP